MSDVAPTMFETFKAFGLIHNTHSRDFKFFTAPTFRYEMGLTFENGSVYCVGMPWRLEGVVVFEGVIAVGGVSLNRGVGG